MNLFFYPSEPVSQVELKEFGAIEFYASYVYANGDVFIQVIPHAASLVELPEVPEIPVLCIYTYTAGQC